MKPISQYENYSYKNALYGKYMGLIKRQPQIQELMCILIDPDVVINGNRRDAKFETISNELRAVCSELGEDGCKKVCEVLERYKPDDWLL